MTALVIGEYEFKAIVALIERARKTPIPWNTVDMFQDQTKRVLKLEDRPKGVENRPKSERITLPMGYDVAFSFEEQPAGLVRHLSISVPKPGLLPNQQAADMIAKAFGIIIPDASWLEEFEPGHFALNIAALDTP